MGTVGGGVSSCQNPFMCWWLYQGTQEDIKIRGVFTLQKIPINSTAAALNAEINMDLLRMHPWIVDVQWLWCSACLIEISDD